MGLNALKFKPEYLSLLVNLTALCYYTYTRTQTGKIIYWLGAVLLTVGLIKMKG